MANEFYDVSGTIDSSIYINPVEQSGRRTLCRNQCGWLWTAFQNDSDTSQIIIQYSVDLGVTWIDDGYIESPLGSVYSVQMALDEDEVPHVFWQAGTDASYSWLMSGKTNDDGTWSDPSIIYVAATLVTQAPGGPADNFTGSWAFDDDGYIHGLWIAYDRPFTPPDSLPPSTNLFYTTNESGSFVTQRCLTGSEGTNADGTSNDTCACPAIAIDDLGNLHGTFMFSSRTAYTVGDEIITTVVTNSSLRRHFFRKKKGLPLPNIKEMALQSSYDWGGTNDVSRSYAQMIASYRGSICVDEEFKAHFAYKWSAYPFTAETSLYYGRISSYQFLPYNVLGAALTSSDTNPTQNPSVCVSKETGSNGEVRAHVLFEGSGFAIGGMTNTSVTNILYFLFDDPGVGITGLTNLTDRNDITHSPMTMSCIHPTFLVPAQLLESKFILLYLEDNTAGVLTKLRIAKANGHGYQIPAYVVSDLMPCCPPEPDLTSVVLQSESVLNAGTLTIQPDFPLEITERFDTDESVTEARHSVTTGNTLVVRKFVRMMFRNIDSSTLTTLKSLISTAKGSKGYFAWDAPYTADGYFIVGGRWHILEESILFAKIAPGIYAIGFTAEQLRT